MSLDGLSKDPGVAMANGGELIFLNLSASLALKKEVLDSCFFLGHFLTTLVKYLNTTSELRAQENSYRSVAFLNFSF